MSKHKRLGSYILNSGNCWYLENSASHSACVWGGFISLTRCQSTMESPDSVSLIETNSSIQSVTLIYKQNCFFHSDIQSTVIIIIQFLTTFTLWHLPKQQPQPPAHCSPVTSALRCGLLLHLEWWLLLGRTRPPPLLWLYSGISEQATVVPEDSVEDVSKEVNEKNTEQQLLHAILVNCFQLLRCILDRNPNSKHTKDYSLLWNNSFEEIVIH